MSACVVKHGTRPQSISKRSRFPAIIVAREGHGNKRPDIVEYLKITAAKVMLPGRYSMSLNVAYREKNTIHEHSISK